MQSGRASWTARWVATQRATHHDTRPDLGDADAERRLYEDLSIRLLGIKLAAPSGMAARTRFIDEQLLQALERGVQQVVLVGAGYDGRALRFGDAPVAWIEIDHPATQADKIRRLARVGATTRHITFVGIDLLEAGLDAELERAGHDPARSTLWVCEGLFPYLPPTVIEALCRTLRSRSDEEGVLVCNVLVRTSPTWLNRAVHRGVDRLLAGLGETRMCEFPPGAIEGFLARAGWDIATKEATTPSRADGSYMLAIAATPTR
jgi:methyltransferase (TIGR00027 family)